MTKRNVSILIPYYREGDDLKVFLQKRSETAERLPGYFGFWGGGAEENETPEQTLIREVQEELGITLDIASVQLFYTFELFRSTKSVYVLEVEPGWENSITIGEGDFGQWFALESVFQETHIILEDKVILNSLERDVLKKPIR